jgi:hypothetical protein
MTVVRWLARGIAALAALLLLVFFGARFHDGPLGMIPGGPLVAGELVAEPVSDWSFARETPEIELQLESQSRSRTVWILVHEGRAFVPCSLSFPPGKTWYREAARDGRAMLRIEGRRYPARLRKLDDGDTPLAIALRAEAERKYPARPPGDPSQVWIFAVEPRGAAGG